MLPRNDRRLIGSAADCDSGFAGSSGVALRSVMAHPFCEDSDADLLLFSMPAVDATVLILRSRREANRGDARLDNFCDYETGEHPRQREIDEIYKRVRAGKSPPVPIGQINDDARGQPSDSEEHDSTGITEAAGLQKHPGEQECRGEYGKQLNDQALRVGRESISTNRREHE